MTYVWQTDRQTGLKTKMELRRLTTSWSESRERRYRDSRLDGRDVLRLMWTLAASQTVRRSSDDGVPSRPTIMSSYNTTHQHRHHGRSSDDGVPSRPTTMSGYNTTSTQTSRQVIGRWSAEQADDHVQLQHHTSTHILSSLCLGVRVTSGSIMTHQRRALSDEPTVTTETDILQLQVQSCGTAFQLNCDELTYTSSFQRFKWPLKAFLFGCKDRVGTNC